MDGRGRTGEIVYLLDLQSDGVHDVVANDLQEVVVQEMADVVSASGVEVIENDDIVAFV